MVSILVNAVFNISYSLYFILYICIWLRKIFIQAGYWGYYDIDYIITGYVSCIVELFEMDSDQDRLVIFRFLLCFLKEMK